MEIPTLPDDELVLPHFEQRLLAHLVAAQKSGRFQAPAATGVVATNGAMEDPAITDLGPLQESTPAARSTARRRWAVVVAGGVAAAVLAAALVVLQGDGELDVSSDNPSQEDPDEATKQKIVDALGIELGGSIVHTANDGPTGRESWYDAVSHAERHILPGPGGQPVDRGRSVPPDFHEDGPPDLAPVRDVNFCRKEWADVEAPWLSIGTVVETMRSGLRSGELRVDGTEVIEGRELIRVVADVEILDEELDDLEASGIDPAEAEQLAADLAAGRASSSPTYYVDPVTYLPVLVAEIDGSTTTVEFLPRESSLQLLVPPIPEGFTQVPDITTDDEIAILGCL